MFVESDFCTPALFLDLENGLADFLIVKLLFEELRGLHPDNSGGSALFNNAETSLGAKRGHVFVLLNYVAVDLVALESSGLQ